MKYKRFFLTLLLLFTVFYLLSSALLSSDAQWKELKGDHFIIYYQGQERFASEVLRKAESSYHQISSDLGYTRYSNFWMWDNRVKIYIYPSREVFLKETKGVKWSHGLADYTKKQIHSYELREGFLDSVLPHEITHLIFRDYVGFKGQVPVWLDEGVAQWEEPSKRAVAKQMMRFLVESGQALSMRQLMDTDVRKTTDSVSATNFYIQAVSVVDFFVEEMGADDFVTFCRQLRDGKSLEQALAFTYPISMRTLKELEEKWKKYVMQAETVEGYLLVSSE